MNLLLDTHTLLWWLDDNPTLSEKAKTCIADAKNVVFISAVVIWEIRIKQALRKLRIPKNFEAVLGKEPFIMLSITAGHAHAVGRLPMHHRDPFDRMLIAQSTQERLTLVTRDKVFEKYKVQLIKA